MEPFTQAIGSEETVRQDGPLWQFLATCHMKELIKFMDL